ncbi:histidine kinase [Alteromonas sp. W364]|jgi:sensor histidine kinase YesM|uniref:sensor histidine kinase n=1 Tax=Alteromonas sp. W364 TaxID=3075610 RepID=UPI0028857DAE|nr:histidine kinase [Alteromonas sp. W364]MDT0627920.1 histidine kinase [Alteromonas sp. W364]
MSSQIEQALPNDSQLQLSNDSLFSDNHKPSFWLLHIAGWIAYVIIFSFDNILFTYETDASFGIILPLIGSAAIAFLLTLPLRYIYRRCWHLNSVKLIILIVVLSLLVALIWTPAKNYTMSLYYALDGMSKLDKILEGGDINPWGILSSLSYAFFMILVWSSMYFGINYHYRLLDEKKLHLEALRLSHHAQIKMLRYQINPHFLFNTLNAISTLVLQGQKERANGMLVRLSTFLRFSLDNDPEKKIALYDEIKALMMYLEIEKTRFDDRLSINIQVEPEAEMLMVPSLLLQPLIENSIKYAISKMESGGVIGIQAYCAKGMLHLSVSDNGPGVADCKTQSKVNEGAAAHNGVGIQNIRDRLAVLYPHNHMFDVDCTQDQSNEGECEENTGSGFKVKIAIPMERA